MHDAFNIAEHHPNGLLSTVANVVLACSELLKNQHLSVCVEAIIQQLRRLVQRFVQLFSLLKNDRRGRTFVAAPSVGSEL